MKKLFIISALTLFFLQSPVFSQEPVTSATGETAENKSDANGNKIGKWIEKEGDITWTGDYLSNLKEGNWVGFYPNQFVAKLVAYKQGMKDGILIQMDRKGKVTLTEHYQKDKLDGVAISYGQSGDVPLSVINYTGGRKNGLFRQYYDNGKIQEETWYRDDLKHGLSRWNNKTGQRIAEYNYEDGNFSGIQKTYYENDTLQSVMNYMNNVLTGESKEYYRNGRIKLSGVYREGLKEGNWTEFNELGNVQRVIKYKAGNEVKK